MDAGVGAGRALVAAGGGRGVRIGVWSRVRCDGCERGSVGVACPNGTGLSSLSASGSLAGEAEDAWARLSEHVQVRNAPVAPVEWANAASASDPPTRTPSAHTK